MIGLSLIATPANTDSTISLAFQVGETHAFITRTCPCNVYSLNPHFYVRKLGFAGVYLFFSSPEPSGSQGELIGWP